MLGALAAGQLDPARLVLVVLADDLADDLAVTAHLEELRALGVRVCVDGFGTHEGPTDRWSRLPVDLVRIDPETLSGGPLRTSLLRLTVETAHTFGWEVVGSGVRGTDQAAALAAVGCEYAQGPMSRRTVAALSPPRPGCARHLRASGAGAPVPWRGHDDVPLRAGETGPGRGRQAQTQRATAAGGTGRDQR